MELHADPQDSVLETASRARGTPQEADAEVGASREAVG